MILKTDWAQIVGFVAFVLVVVLVAFFAGRNRHAQTVTAMSAPKVGRWIYGIWSEADGTASWGHIGSTVALLAVVGWISYLIFKTHVMPGLGDSAVFVGTPFTIGKAASTINQWAPGRQQ
jgi:hypothetical protein